MRGTRWLLLVAILAILAGIGVTYRTQKTALRKQAPAKPVMLPTQLAGVRTNFEYEHRTENRLVARILAQTVKQEKDSSQIHLEQVELHIINKDGETYNRVKSASAEFNQSESRLYSDGEVEMTLRVPLEGQPTHALVNIKSSGVTFEVKTGKASTDRVANFTFENGTGKSLGASYDPTTRELHLRSQAEIDWKAPGPRAAPMKIEAGEVVYKEAESKVWLNQWARLTRENTLVNAATAVVQLQDGVIRQIDALKAQGVDEYPRRKLQYAAEELRVTYNELGEVERVSGKHNARLVSVSDGSETTMTSDIVDLDFETLNLQNSGDESVLKKVVGTGDAMVESKPVAVPGGKPAETRVLRSQTIEMDMRPGGREIQMVETHAPGRLDFIPNQPNQRRRRLDAERMAMTYGPGNQIQSFRAVNVQTETEPTAEERARKHTELSRTRSKSMTAEFDPKTGQMKRMEQWDDFSYEEGDRRARAHHAVMEADSNLITLETGARMWDATGATSADGIRLDQKTGDFSADGHVSSSRQPEKKKQASEILSGDEPIEALAEKMTAANHNRLLHYEGHVVMWQGADRITADRMDIDREKRTLTATGGVVTQFLEKAQSSKETGKEAVGAGDGGTPPASTFVIVKAAGLVYTEQDRLAHYTGGVLLNRPGLRVKADDLRAFLSESKAGEKKETDDQQSRIEKAYADGHVEIVQTAVDRTRTGTGDHAEYYTGDERIVLRGGQPQMVDSKRGYTRGVELTYYADDDRLLVTGGPKERAIGRLRRKSP